MKKIRMNARPPDRDGGRSRRAVMKGLEMSAKTAKSEIGEEYDAVLGEKLRRFSQLVLDGKLEEAHKVSVTIPIHPRVARNFKSALGKEYILSEGYDLSLANAELGEGWIHEPDED